MKKLANSILSRSSNAFGFGMLETLIAASIIGILCLGMGTVAVNMSKAQEQANLYSVLNVISNNMQKVILDPNAWTNTVNSPYNDSVYHCIQTLATCYQTSGYPAAAGTELAVYPGPGVLMNGDSLPTPTPYYTDALGEGFSYSGSACHTFVNNMSAPGSDQCPISYRLRTALHCPSGAASCQSPMVAVFAILQYHPGPWGTNFVVNTARYSVSVERSAGAINRNDSIRVEDFAATNSNALTVGPCANSPGGGNYRTFSPVAIDLAGNLINPPSTDINLRAGGYVCNAIATGYGIDGFNISMEVDSVTVATSTTSFAASPNGVAQARILDIAINRNVPFRIKILQRCASAGTAQAFGLPSGLGPREIYAGVYCTRVY